MGRDLKRPQSPCPCTKTGSVMTVISGKCFSNSAALTTCLDHVVYSKAAILSIRKGLFLNIKFQSFLLEFQSYSAWIGRTDYSSTPCNVRTVQVISSIGLRGFIYWEMPQIASSLLFLRLAKSSSFFFFHILSFLHYWSTPSLFWRLSWPFSNWTGQNQTRWDLVCN